MTKQLFFYVLSNTFSYNRLASAFVTQIEFYYVHDDTDAFFIFLLQRDFDIVCMLLFGAVLWAFDNSYLSSFLYIEKKIMKNILLAIFCALIIM